MMATDDGNGWWQRMMATDDGNGWWQWMVATDGGNRFRWVDYLFPHPLNKKAL